MSDDRPEFSVWVFWVDGIHEPVLRFVRGETAVRAARRVTRGYEMLSQRAPDLRAVEKVIITDGGDDTVFQWEPGKGVVWPPREQPA